MSRENHCKFFHTFFLLKNVRKTDRTLKCQSASIPKKCGHKIH
ncbi:hypothetical protein HMPREF9996_01405 [Aggregatibacter actinomycetemcomitans Y4]|nr:hypothetical protein CF65_00271 [Aggregatibacter actinomycetemcomitans HK1651]EKX95716.1 hypothetical protein HMPREF9996_01405 [Aggregatibacter actinomycetemcomitans Y4]